MPNSVSLIRHLYEFRIFIDIAVNSDSFDAHSFGSFDDSACDLSSIGDKYLFD
jgi:hypothetical protein